MPNIVNLFVFWFIREKAYDATYEKRGEITNHRLSDYKDKRNHKVSAYICVKKNHLTL